jgi:hypothetical protein
MEQQLIGDFANMRLASRDGGSKKEGRPKRGKKTPTKKLSLKPEDERRLAAAFAYKAASNNEVLVTKFNISIHR